MKTIVIAPNTRPELRDLNGLAELQAAVGGDIEVHYGKDFEFAIYVHADAKWNGAPIIPNPVGDWLMEDAGLMAGDQIVGTIIVFGGGDSEDVPQSVIDRLGLGDLAQIPGGRAEVPVLTTLPTGPVEKFNTYGGPRWGFRAISTLVDGRTFDRIESGWRLKRDAVAEHIEAVARGGVPKHPARALMVDGKMQGTSVRLSVFGGVR